MQLLFLPPDGEEGEEVVLHASTLGVGEEEVEEVGRPIREVAPNPFLVVEEEAAAAGGELGLQQLGRTRQKTFHFQEVELKRPGQAWLEWGTLKPLVS